MEPTTKQQLEGIVSFLNEIMPNKNFRLESGYGKYKLTSNNGTHNESHYMSKKELYYWLHAYKSGFFAAKGE